jgi:high-affinity iron transporter
MYLETTSRPATSVGWSTISTRIFLIAAAALVVAVLVWQGFSAAGNPDPLAARRGSLSGVLDIGVLVFREGLECILVLSAVTAGMSKAGEDYERPVALGVAVAFLATLAAWFGAVRLVNDLTRSIPALYVQAATGLLAIIVLLVVMNWFFHKVYWTGWISMHTKKKRTLLESAGAESVSRQRLLFGMALLGFTSFFREGIEVVLFLQSYRLKLGGTAVLYGVLAGACLTAAVAVLTFVARRRLPYKRMLVLTGVMLGVVLLIMVGEQAQEMQLAHWLPTTPIRWLSVPGWMGLWFSVFPTVETLTAQSLAGGLVLGSYFVARK